MPAPRSSSARESAAVRLLGFEAACVLGSISLQGEYVMAAVDPLTGSDLRHYLQASYFLTGEHRKYDTETAEFDRIKPTSNAIGPGSGRGAIELAIRNSSMDLDDGAITGGELDDLSLGMNW